MVVYRMAVGLPGKGAFLSHHAALCFTTRQLNPRIIQRSSRKYGLDHET